MTEVYNSWKHLEESVLLPSYSALNVLSLSLPLLLMVYYSQALFQIMSQLSMIFITVTTGLLKKRYLTSCP